MCFDLDVTKNMKCDKMIPCILEFIKRNCLEDEEVQFFTDAAE